MFTRTLLALCLVTIGSVAYAGGSEDIAFDELPDVVAATILTELDGAQIHDLESITIEDRTMYIVESRIAGGKIELHVADHGGVILRRADIPVSAAPTRVQETLAGYGGEIDDLERVSGDGSVRYEAEIEFANGLEVNVVAAEDGAIMSEREELDD